MYVSIYMYTQIYFLTSVYLNKYRPEYMGMYADR